MVEFKFDEFARSNERIVISKSVYLEGELVEHAHNFIELVYVFRGSGFHIINGKRDMIQHGDFLMIGSNSSHTFYPATKDFVWINCLFLPEIIYELYDLDKSDQLMRFFVKNNAFQQNKISLTDTTIHSLVSEVEIVFDAMLKEYNRQGNNYQKILELYLMVLFLKIIPHIQNTAPKNKEIPDASLNNLEEIVLEFFTQFSSYENIHISDIAKTIYVSPKYFSNLFKKRTGKNLSAFIQQIKLDRASSLLKNSKMNILEIMNMVGYNDSKFFYQIFKKQFGVTPGEYRKLAKQNRLPESDTNTKI